MRRATAIGLVALAWTASATDALASIASVSVTGSEERPGSHLSVDAAAGEANRIDVSYGTGKRSRS